MDTQNLTAFISIADTGSFSAAAEQLHLTQPAISKRIRNLEEQVGYKLLDRIGRKVVPTEAGNNLLPNARTILQQIRDSQQALDDLSGPVRGTLKLATSHHIGLHRLPEVLQAYRQHHGEVKLNISFCNSYETHQAILSGAADIGITTEEQMAVEQIVSLPVWQDRLEFVVSAGHPLATAPGAPTLAQLAEYPAILPDAKFTTGRIVRELFTGRGLHLKIDEDLSTDYLETLKALVSIGSAWSVLPHTMLDGQELKVLTPAGVSLGRNLVCIRHRARTLNRASQAFLKLLDKG